MHATSGGSTPHVAHAQIETPSRDAFEMTKRRKPHQRVYWRNTGETIEASRGKPTDHVCVYSGHGGEVHGHPITLEELKRKEALR